MSTDSSCADPADLLYLASASPRRRDLLQQLGVRLEVVPQDLDETRRENEPPLEYVTRLAREKAAAAWGEPRRKPAPVLGADTAVVCNTEVLGKPVDAAQAVDMLLMLSGRWHRVVTGVALRYNDTDLVTHSETRVKFRPLSREEAQAYVQTGEPMDKAGAYGIQGLGSRLVERIEGSYSGVVGLPLVETEALLRRAGLRCRW